jgi:hypothetical protein
MEDAFQKRKTSSILFIGSFSSAAVSSKTDYCSGERKKNRRSSSTTLSY